MTAKKTAVKKSKRDFTKYGFNGQVYGKGRLALAVIQDYVEKHPEVTVPILQTVFTEEIVSTLKKDKESQKRFFTDELIKIGTKSLMVTNQWSKNNINNFIEFAKKHFKHEIKIISKKELKDMQIA